LLLRNVDANKHVEIVKKQNMNKLVEQYIANVKKEVVRILNLCETVCYPVVFKFQLDRERFPRRDEYTANVLYMMTAYKRLVGYEGTEEEYEKLSKEYNEVEVVEDGRITSSSRDKRMHQSKYPMMISGNL
jgi:hypothetical protein